MILTPYAEMEFFARILVAALCGAFIGYERNNRLKEAGIRTHLIVALAAALIICSAVNALAHFSMIFFSSLFMMRQSFLS